MTLNINNFFDGPFFDGPFFDAGIPIGGHGAGQAGEDGDAYAEPRRVMIAGKPFTVRSKGEYLALLRRFGRKDVPRETKQPAQKQADAVIAKAQESARESLQARQTAEIRELLLAKLQAEEIRKRREERAFIDGLEVDPIPMPILLMLAADL